MAWIYKSELKKENRKSIEDDMKNNNIRGLFSSPCNVQ